MSKTEQNSEVVKYFLLVFLLSVPFWALGSFIDLSGKIPINLPFGALMLVCPMISTLILTPRGERLKLLNRILDFPRIENIFFYPLIFFLTPFLIFVTYLLMKFLGIHMPSFEINFWDTILMFGLFFIAAIAEEIGWTGFATEKLQADFGIIKTGLIIGFVWAIWHVVPLLQANREAIWIFWHCLSTVLLRILMVWLYFKIGRSVLAMVIFHASINMSEFLFPRYGSHYDPFYFALVLLTATILFVLLDLENIRKLEQKLFAES